jgi:hypothetical protein
VALIGAGSLTFVLLGHHPRSAGQARASAGRTEAPASSLAAAWVASQVSRGTIVSCDPVMCRALTSRGVPASDLYQIGPTTASPLPSDVIVATASVRAKFGNRLSAVYAPTVIASFGSGHRRIDIRDVAPHGSTAYRSAFHRDLLSRKEAGTALLGNTGIAASAMARRQLLTGEVDSRLLNAIAVMASIHPIYLVAFHSFAPGAAPGIPLRVADVADAGTAPLNYRSATGQFARSMIGFLDAQRAPFRPARTQAVHLAGGHVVLRIEFAAPSPLGLLGA